MNISLPKGATLFHTSTVGSTSHGLSGPDSDVDYAGIFALPPEAFLGIGAPSKSKLTIVGKDPDITLHEIGKFCSLALSGNPTLLETLYPTDLRVGDVEFPFLYDKAIVFLSENKIRKSFGGYAIQQSQRLLKRLAEGREGFDPDTKKRIRKHGRHCARLLIEEANLHRTGSMMVDVSVYRDEIFSLGELAETDPIEFSNRFNAMLGRNNQMDSCLPEEPDFEVVNSWLVNWRKEQL